MRFTAVGDVLILRDLPADGPYSGFNEVRDFIGRGDFRFANLEATIHRYECPPSQQSGGSWVCADPRVLDSVREFGFNMLSLANNHTLDFSSCGVIKTLDYVRQAGFLAAGSGRNLREAAQPVYLDTRSGRYALIALTTSFINYALAGEQSAWLEGRPGVNGIRTKASYQVTESQLEQLEEIAAACGINHYRDLSRKEGFAPALEPGQFEFGEILFQAGSEPKDITKIVAEDLELMEKMIFEASLQADATIVSLHAHQLGGPEKEQPAEFIKTIARRAIDAGAAAVAGHGPHLLRPIEIYQGRPIFYSLGDFVLQNENISRGPAQWFKAQGLAPDATMHELYARRSKDFTRGLYSDRRMFEAVIPYWEMAGDKLARLELLPVELGFDLPHSQNGWPRPAKDIGIIERLAAMSEPYGVQIRLENGLGIVEID